MIGVLNVIKILITMSFQLSIGYVMNNPNANGQTFIRPPQDTTVVEGENIIIHCELQKPHGEVQWIKDDVAMGFDRELVGFPRMEIQGDERKGQFNLLIEDTLLTDRGTYSCEVSPHRNHDNSKRIGFLNVIAPPKFAIIYAKPSDQFSKLSANDYLLNVTLDSKQIEISCVASGSFPESYIIWKIEPSGVMHDTFILEALERNSQSRKRIYLNDDEYWTYEVTSIVKLPIDQHLNGTRLVCQIFHLALRGSILRPTIEIYVQPSSVSKGNHTLNVVRQSPLYDNCTDRTTNKSSAFDWMKSLNSLYETKLRIQFKRENDVIGYYVLDINKDKKQIKSSMQHDHGRLKEAFEVFSQMQSTQNYNGYFKWDLFCTLRRLSTNASLPIYLIIEINESISTFDASRNRNVVHKITLALRIEPEASDVSPIQMINGSICDASDFNNTLFKSSINATMSQIMFFTEHIADEVEKTTGSNHQMAANATDYLISYLCIFLDKNETAKYEFLLLGRQLVRSDRMKNQSLTLQKRTCRNSASGLCRGSLLSIITMCIISAFVLLSAITVIKAISWKNKYLFRSPRRPVVQANAFRLNSSKTQSKVPPAAHLTTVSYDLNGVDVRLMVTSDKSFQQFPSRLNFYNGHHVNVPTSNINNLRDDSPSNYIFQ
ncbi:hypothetical protein ACOME3_008975 [Neoechinorhynchus agilis]